MQPATIPSGYDLLPSTGTDITLLFVLIEAAFFRARYLAYESCLISTPLPHGPIAPGLLAVMELLRELPLVGTQAVWSDGIALSLD